MIITHDKELWGGSYKTIPYWRCQPYFRPVNGVTGDKRIVQELESKKRKAEFSLDSQKEKEFKTK